MDLYVYLESEEKATQVSITNEYQTVGELVRTLAHKLGLLGTRGPGDEELPLELGKFESGVVFGKNERIRDVVSDKEYLVLRHIRRDSSAMDIWKSYYDIQQYQLPVDLQGRKCVELDGYSLTPAELIAIGLGQCQVKLSAAAQERIKVARLVIDDCLEQDKAVYGVNTGFGKFAYKKISREDLVVLQENLIRSHAAGVGPPLSPMRTRMLLALRINVLARGCSGTRLEIAQQLAAALNASCLSYVPEKGTVGASGDLAPLSHLALGMLGEGQMWSPKTGWAVAKEVLDKHGLVPIKLQPKEGIALINGTQLITALGVEALHRAEKIAIQADIVAALSIDVLQGTPRAFEADLHMQRPHAGQQQVAARLRALLDSNIHSSAIREGHRNCQRVQDAYSMRCVPQVHGVVHDTLAFARGILTIEMNSATDNPMVMINRQEAVSAGNFHGEYPAKALDYLAIGIHEIASISERRLERLVHPAYNGDPLPAFLVEQGGLNSGFMLAQVTAAALGEGICSNMETPLEEDDVAVTVSENKVLTHPASVDSITTSAGTEDHVSMGGFAARKALEIVGNVEQGEKP